MIPEEHQRIVDTYLKEDPENSDILINKAGFALLLGVDVEAVELMLMFNGRDTSATAIPQSMVERGREVRKRAEQHIGNEGTLVDVLAFLEKNPGGWVSI